MATKPPTKLTLRTYQVGFGDCFLLSWHYASGPKHVLIDFGSKGYPKAAPKNLMKLIADDIAKETKGRLHAVVLTHRHQDHISGFSTTKAGKGTGDVIRKLNPDLVVQPWTEEPGAKTDARKPTALAARKQGFALMLSHMQDASAGLAEEAARLAATEPLKRNVPMFRRLQFAGEEGIKNLSAIKNLQQMGKRHSYVYHGSKSGLETMLPGVKVTVLGPPTLEQSDAIKKERQVDQEQFWMLQANSGARAVPSGRVLFPNAPRGRAGVLPPYARWFIPRVRAMRAEGMEQIVRVLDDAMNNTSVILLFEVGGQSFLFPGDAQIENWEFTLKNAALMKRLQKVTFYKVGHHGSRNATPKSLWKGFSNKGPASQPGRLATVVSTMADKYGKSEGAEVPRKTLVTALEKDSTFYSTQKLRGKEIRKVFEFTL